MVCVAWSPDRTKLASGGSSDSGVSYSYGGGRFGSLCIFAEHSRIIHPVAWEPTENLMITSGGDGKLRRWDVQSAASLMLNHRLPVLILSKRLGHSKPSITIEVYEHLITSQQE